MGIPAGRRDRFKGDNQSSMIVAGGRFKSAALPRHMSNSKFPPWCDLKFVSLRRVFAHSCARAAGQSHK
jgi:hypothetical protein